VRPQRRRDPKSFARKLIKIGIFLAGMVGHGWEHSTALAALQVVEVEAHDGVGRQESEVP